MDRVFPYLLPSYSVTIFNPTREPHMSTVLHREYLSRSMAADLMRRAKDMEYPFEVKHTGTTLVYPHPVPECYGCGVRPALWDMDCDGPYATAECGQCSWWDAVNAREAQEDRCAMGEAKVRDRAALADVLSCVPGLF